MNPTPTLLAKAATAAVRAAEDHLAGGCTTCRRGARLAELCTDGQRAVLEAVQPHAPGLLEPEPTEPTADPFATAVRTDPALPGPARLAALMRSRQHWRDGRLVSEGTLSQAEIRTALGWGDPDQVHGVTWEPGRLEEIRGVVRVITAGTTAYPDLTDAYVIRQARRLLPELLELVELLHARVVDLEAHGCRCFDPTFHAPGCIKAATRWEGRTYLAGVWYRDVDGEWWLPVAVDARGCLVLQLDADPHQAPAALDELEAEYGPLTATTYPSTTPRGDLPASADEADATLRAHLKTCPDCAPAYNRAARCRTGRELTRAASA
jgi:hypothetical protein